MLCKHHGQLSADQVRTGIYRNKNYRKCRLCERIRSKEYYADPEAIRVKREKDKQYYAANKERIKKHRQSEENKKHRREWYEKNIDQERKRYRQVNINDREKLGDTYIKRVIQNGDKSLPLHVIPKSLIELKRVTMLAKRTIKKVRGSNEINQHREIKGSRIRIAGKAGKKQNRD